MPSHQRTLWQHPLGLAEAVLVCMGLLIVGVFLDFWTPNPLPLLAHWPLNLFSLCLLVALLLLTAIFLRRSALIKWLSGLPMVISAIMGFAITGLALAFFPFVLQTWVYSFSLVWLLFILGLCILTRPFPNNLRRLSALLSHLGLFLALAGAHLGSGDLERLSMELQEGETSWIATDRAGRPLEMNLAMKLEEFKLEEYPPTLALMDKSGNALVKGAVSTFIEPGAVFDLGDWQVAILDYLPFSLPMGERYRAVHAPGAVHGLQVSVRPRGAGEDTAESQEGWLGTASHLTKPVAMDLPGDQALIMLEPRPRAFISRIRLYQKDGPATDLELQVNRPAYLSGWKIYQQGYDQAMGRWSTTSIVELVKDPWLPLVYAGIYMMMAGAMLLFFLRPRGA